ncbi:MAG: CusA/CzcA family heavy metal efflux RND transporter, partial [Bdellovibrionales bacterium]|nr:CusA/CzcA family heavy metal efflux RND transporter [Bdellovibrionales bacterium]
NISTGAGYIESRGEYYLVRADSRLAGIKEIQSVVIGERGNIPIRIQDIGGVHIGKELRTGSASTRGEEAVVGTALMLIGENSRTVSAAVHEKLEEVNRSLPPGIVANPVLNRTKLVDATIATVERNLSEGAILVVLILFALLGNFRAALITALAIPLSMLMTVTGMVQTKMSGNLMSLGAIDFGLIVDGAVIIIENCVRRIAEKQNDVGRILNLKERLHEVFTATKEMIQPSVFGQAIIITVYIPILFLTGIEGKLFQPMALTVILALVSAFLLSLTFIPGMAAIFLSGKVQERENRALRCLKCYYEKGLNWSVKQPWTVVVIAVIPFVLSLIIFFRLGQVFVPALDEGDIAMHAMRIPSTSLTQSQKMQFEVERALESFPEIKVAFSKTGTAEVASDPMPPNVSDTFILLEPREEWPDRSKTKLELIEEIQEAVMQLPGNNYEFTQPIQMRFNELISGVRGDIAVKVFGDEFERLLPVANEIAAVLQNIRGAADVKVEQVLGLPTLNIDIDKEKISRLGLDASDVHAEVAAAVGGQEAGFIFQGDRRFDLIVRLADTVREDIDSLNALPIPIKGGAHTRTDEGSEGDLFKTEYLRAENAPSFVPLRSIAKLHVEDGPNQISRENGKRRIVVQANIRGRDLGSFVAEAQDKVEQQVNLAAGSWLAWGGQFENLVAAKRRLSVVVPICFLLILILLFSALGSMREALVVFSGVPLGLTGGVIALWLRGIPFSISAAVGFIALSGVAVLNGLVMVSRINQLKREGESPHKAVIDGALSRLRPVLMTALVASLGFLPMALATGTGAEVQRPLATVVVGGLITATVLTLFVLPALLCLFAWGRDIDAEKEAL